jgi:hypothetical protein
MPSDENLAGMRLLVILSLASCLLLQTGRASAADDVAPPPTRVFVGLHIVAIRSLDVRAQSFFADFYLWFRFATTDEERAKEIDEKLEAVNGQFDSKEEVDRKQVGDETYVCYRITGTFYFTATLADYPFDRQSLDIVLENSNLETDAMVFADDVKSYERSKSPKNLWGLQPSVCVPEFVIKGVRRQTTLAGYPTTFGDPERTEADSTYSRFTVSVVIERTYVSYLLKIVIPLMVILAMAYLVFFLPSRDIDSASATVVTALLTCMAFNVAVAQNMPEVGYLVLSDKFFIASYLLLLLTLAETIATYVLDDRGQTAAAQRLDRLGIWLFPAAVAALFVAVAIAH